MTCAAEDGDGFLKGAGVGGGSGESPGRNKGMEAWKGMVSAGNSKQMWLKNP